jgi:hypothetical protein
VLFNFFFSNSIILLIFLKNTLISKKYTSFQGGFFFKKIVQLKKIKNRKKNTVETIVFLKKMFLGPEFFQNKR